MSNRKLLGWSIIMPLALVFLYFTFWVMGYWGGYKPLLSLPELIITALLGLFALGVYLVVEPN